MNICLVTSSFPLDSADVNHAPFLGPVVRVLQQAGHRVTVLTQMRTGTGPEAPAAADVECFQWRGAASDRVAELSLASPRALMSAASLVYGGMRSVGRMRTTHRVDLFLCAWVIPSGGYALLDRLLSGARTPYVVWALGSDVNKYRSNPVVRFLLRQIVRRAGHAYAHGFRLRDDVQAITGCECEFLPVFSPSRLADTWCERKRTATPARFLYVGRHAPVKGTDVLVDAVIALKRLGNTNYALDIVGEGALRSELERRIAAADLTEQVRFRGKLSDEALRDAYSRADCLVIPSRSESLPLVLTEGVQYGLPVIVTDVGDMGHVATRYRLGAVVPAEAPLRLADSMNRFIAHPWRLDPHSRAQLLDDLSFERAAPRFLERLQMVCDTAKQRALHAGSPKSAAQPPA